MPPEVRPGGPGVPAPAHVGRTTPPMLRVLADELRALLTRSTLAAPGDVVAVDSPSFYGTMQILSIFIIWFFDKCIKKFLMLSRVLLGSRPQISAITILGEVRDSVKLMVTHDR